MDWHKAGKEAATGNFYENDIHFITAVRSHGDCINKGGQDMSVVLKEAIRQAGCADIKLVAGKNGLTNAVEWVHMVDTTEIADFLSESVSVKKCLCLRWWIGSIKIMPVQW